MRRKHKIAFENEFLKCVYCNSLTASILTSQKDEISSNRIIDFDANAATTSDAARFPPL